MSVLTLGGVIPACTIAITCSSRHLLYDLSEVRVCAVADRGLEQRPDPNQAAGVGTSVQHCLGWYGRQLLCMKPMHLTQLSQAWLQAGQVTHTLLFPLDRY